MSSERHVTELLRASGGSLPFESTEFAAALDAADPLREHRDAFIVPQGKNGDLTYCASHALGLQHKGVADELQRYLTKWSTESLQGWGAGADAWIKADEWLRDDMAEIVGARPHEVVAMNSLTVNLHLLLAAFYKPHGQRRKLLCERFPFPSDMHAFVSQIEFHGGNADDDLIEIGEKGATEPHIVSTETIVAALETHKDTAAVLILAAVHSITGQFFDIPTIARAARERGILVCVDAAHAAGNVPLHLHDWDVDFAVWCHYKYLNAGPGAIGGAFVHERHIVAAEPGSAPAIRTFFKGWWGNRPQTRFALQRTFEFAEGAAALQLSSPPIVAIASLIPSLKLAAKIGLPALRAKSVMLTGYLEALLDTRLRHALQILTPRDHNARGAYLSMRILLESVRSEEPPATAVQRLLLEHGVLIDCRAPDILRISPSPTFNSYEEVLKVFRALEEVLASFPIAK